MQIVETSVIFEDLFTYTNISDGIFGNIWSYGSKERPTWCSIFRKIWPLFCDALALRWLHCCFNGLVLMESWDLFNEFLRFLIMRLHGKIDPSHKSHGAVTTIPQWTIWQQRCAHMCTILLQNGALRDMGLVECGICATRLWSTC